MLFQLIDFFIGQPLVDAQDRFYKTRLLVGIILAVLASLLVFTPAFVFAYELSVTSLLAFTAIATFVLVVWGALLFLLKAGKGYYFCSHMTCASLLLVLFLSIAITGGPSISPVNPLLFVPVIIAFLLLGKSQGFLWVCANASLFFAALLAEYFGVNFTQMLKHSANHLLQLYIWVYAFVIISALVMLYETLNAQLTIERDQEHARIRDIAEKAVESSLMYDNTDFLSNTGDQLLQSVLQQKSAVDQLSATADELRASSANNAQTAQHAKSAIGNTQEHLHVSQADIQLLVQGMQSLDASSQKIQSINNVINDIAYQTNLLSLNAMIEASRAGEGSGGFKVVAMEIKKLAERSANAANDINALLKENFDKVNQGVELSEAMQLRFIETQEKMQPLAESVHSVSNASFEQNEAIRQFSEGLYSISEAVNNNQYLTEQLAAHTEALKDNSQSLMDIMQILETV